jgi:hypothetical protein
VRQEARQEGLSDRPPAGELGDLDAAQPVAGGRERDYGPAMELILNLILNLLGAL